MGYITFTYMLSDMTAHKFIEENFKFLQTVKMSVLTDHPSDEREKEREGTKQVGKRMCVWCNLYNN